MIVIGGNIMPLFGFGKAECWVCRRKVSDDAIFLKEEDLRDAFTGVFKDMEVKETFKGQCVCEVCAGIVKLLGSETLQAKMKISQASDVLKDKMKGIASRLKK